MLQQCWLFSVAQRVMWDDSLQGESSLVFAWGSVPGGTGSIAGMIVTIVLHHHCGFLVHLKAEANLGLAATVKAEPPALMSHLKPRGAWLEMLAVEMLAWVLPVWWPGQLCPPSSWSTVLSLHGTAFLFPLSQPPPLPLTEGGFCSPVRMGSNAVNPLVLWADPSPALQGWRSPGPAVGCQHSVGKL